MGIKRLKNKSMDELSKIKNIINITIGLLESNIISMKNGDGEFKERELLNFLVGNKENVISIITKLSNMILKLNLLEQKEQDNKDENFNISDIDLEIIKKYLDENTKTNV